LRAAERACFEVEARPRLRVSTELRARLERLHQAVECGELAEDALHAEERLVRGVRASPRLLVECGGAREVTQSLGDDVRGAHGELRARRGRGGARGTRE